MLPAALRPVVRRATSSDPAKRYGSCREMVRELRRAMTETQPAAPRASRTRARRLLVAAFVVAVAAAGGVWAWRTYAPKDEAIPNPVKPPVAQADLTSSRRSSASSAAKPIEPPIVPHPTTNQTDLSHREGETYLERGFTALKNKEFAAAVSDLQRASKLLPRDARVFSRLGAAWFAQEKWDQAIASYTAAIEIEPYDNDYLSRGRAYMELKSADQAIKDFAAAVRLNPSNAAAYVELGDACVDKDDAEQAIAAFSEAVKVCTSDPHANFPQLTARLLRANVYLSTGKKAAAADDLTKALPLLRDDPQSAPSVVDAIDALAKAYAKAGQYDDAVKWAENSVELAPDEKSKEACRQSLKDYKDKQLAARSKRVSP
jgi:tetratricopeptide (TPR) repeat protein